MFELRNRGRLDGPTQEEFESLYARLRGLLSQVFDVDGALIVADPNLAIVPVGGIVPFAGTAAPNGFLLCDGSQVSRVTYKTLFDVIGTTYGAGDGSTTFNLPDLRQRFPLGKAASGTGATLGSTGGTIDHTHSSTHSHSFGGSTDVGGGHSHVVNDHQHSITDHDHTFSGTTGTDSASDLGDTTAPSQQFSVSPHTHAFSGTTSIGGPGITGAATSTTSSDGDHAHGIGGTTSEAIGTTDAANPPFVTVNYLIFSGVN